MLLSITQAKGACKGLSYRTCLGVDKPDRLYHTSLNTAQIIGLGKQYGQDVNNDQAQSLMGQFNGGNDVAGMTQYFQNQKNANDVTSAASTAQTNFTNLAATDTGLVNDFVKKYGVDTTSAIDTANTTFKLPEQLSTVNNLTSRISDLANNTSNSAGGAESGTGLGGYNSEAQVGAEINDRELPQLNTATTNLNNSETAAQNQENIALAPDKAYQQMLTTNITTAMQGLTTTQGQTLSAIIDKLDQGISLTENENTTGEALAQATLSAANNLTIQQMKNAYTAIPAGNTVIDPATGRIINPGTLTSSNGGQYQI